MTKTISKPVIIFAIVSLAIVFFFYWLLDIYPIGCGGYIVCHATRDYPPNCGPNGEVFMLRKNRNMTFEGKIIPDGAFYYIHPIWQENVPTYIAVSPIEIADYNSINLEEFVDKKVCIKGKYRYGLPSFFIDSTQLPEGMDAYSQVVADVKEIKLVE